MQSLHLRDVQNKSSAPPPLPTHTDTTSSAGAGSANSSLGSTQEEEGPQCLFGAPHYAIIGDGPYREHVLLKECIQKYWSTIDDSSPKECVRS